MKIYIPGRGSRKNKDEREEERGERKHETLFVSSTKWRARKLCVFIGIIS